MNISEVKNLIEGASYEDKVEILENIVERVGDTVEVGFLGSSVSNISYDENGILEFQSEKKICGEKITSTGAVLEDSVTIMQIQENNSNRLLQLYSWKADGSKYTYLTFDSLLAMENAYCEIKKQNIGFLAECIDEDLQKIGVSYRDIMDIKVAISVLPKEHKHEVEILDFEKLLASFVS